MMIQSMDPPHSFQSRTAEIMSRYRRIAPKPATEPPTTAPAAGTSPESPLSSEKAQQPLRINSWDSIHDRPTRTRRRGGRGACFPLSLPPHTFKRVRTVTHHLLPLSPSPPPPPPPLSLHGFPSGRWPRPGSLAIIDGGGFFGMPSPVPLVAAISSPHSAAARAAVLLSEPGLQGHDLTKRSGGEEVIDLNNAAAAAEGVPEEKDLLRQLQEPHAGNGNVIAPQPIRPVGSSVSVGWISEKPAVILLGNIPRRPEEVEEEAEAEIFPVVISDSKNKVRVANSAYKEMVGQPECPWLGLGGGGGGGGGACSRISGEVMLRLPNGKTPAGPTGFTCWVRIEWGSNGKKSAVDAFCDATRLSCQAKDYTLAWRFHTHAKEPCQAYYA